MQIEELKPCPFCGDNDANLVITKTPHMAECAIAEIRCGMCKASTGCQPWWPEEEFGGVVHKLLIHRWNMRAKNE